MKKFERVFYISVAGIPPQDIPTYMEKVKENLLEQTGKVKDGELTIDNYFIPIRRMESHVEYYELDDGVPYKTLVFPKDPATIEDIDPTKPS
jgi:hypothetical protein